ncbi:MAG: hypothetical protein OEZ54_10935, partial [Gemmatimonadota bacterium]|nr:hypothetical protein [Gemmatimonadota bacterium]
SGLKWIQSMEIALLVLVAGLAVNMALAYVVGVQGFASLHVVLSLIPLALVPQSVTSIVLATAVTGTGLALSLKKSWDVHVAITLAAYLVFHLVWYAGVEVPKPDVVGLASALVISAAIVGVHLLERDQAVRLRAARLLTHLAAWTAGGIGSILYIEEPWIRSAALAALSIAAFSVSRKAKASSVRWMHLGDVLTAQALAIAAVVSLHTLMFHWMLVPAILLAQAWLFLLVVNNENEEMLVRVGMHLVHAFILLMFAGTVFILPVEDPDLKNQLTVLLFASAGLTTLLHADVARKRGHEFDSSSMYGLHSHKTNWSHSWSAVGSGLLACAGIFLQYEGRWLAWSALGATSFMLFVARRAKSPSLGLGALVTVLAGCVLTWIPLLDYHPVEIGRQLGYHFPPLFLAALFTIIWAPTGTTHRFVTNAGSYLLGVHLGISAFTLLQPISPYIPAVMWLCLAVIALEVANRVPLHLIRPAVHAGLGYMTAFAGAYALVILQSDIQIGIVSLREIIEAFALAVAVYWWTYRPKTDLAEDKTWRLINPLFLELGLVFLAIVVTVETPTHWRPAAWVALAWVAAASRAPTKLDTRFTFYSILFYWLSAADLVIVTSSYVFPTGSWINKPGFTGGIAIALQIFYLALGTKHLDLSRVSFPRALSAFERLTQAMAARRHLWIYYPFFVSTALFLYWRFDATLLTLLWSVEAFIVFALSIVLKESHFRYMAIGALVACLVRLVVFDLSQANLGLRGLVFVGVGLMMLAMNALYNKYKERLS